jgi:iduronate 2-sulfatase
MKVFTCSVLSLVFLYFSCTNNQIEIQNPNILFIAVDDLRPELGCYGQSHIHSPNIDKLADHGTLFLNSYCNVPVCGGSRASLLTGLRPTLNRFKLYYTRADEDAPEVTTLPGIFKQHGYTTISNGKIFHHRDDSQADWNEIWRGKGTSPLDYITPENISLDTIEGQRGFPFERTMAHDTAYIDGKMTEKAIQDLKRLKEEGNPFFLAVGYLKPHLPFNAPNKYWDLYPKEMIELPPNRFFPTDVPSQALHNSGELRAYHSVPPQGPVSDSMAKTLIHGYYACVSYTDALIGQLLEALERLELDQNTIVVLWGDHGWNLYEHGLWCKHSNYRTSLKAPLIIRLPGQKSGSVRNEMVEFVDIYPTLTELCNFTAPDHLQGMSLKPLLMDSRVDWKDRVESVWRNGFTYTTNAHAFTEWRTEADSITARMLFDHVSDPGENVNIAEKEGNEKIMESLSPIIN